MEIRHGFSSWFVSMTKKADAHIGVNSFLMCGSSLTVELWVLPRGCRSYGKVRKFSRFGFFPGFSFLFGVVCCEGFGVGRNIGIVFIWVACKLWWNIDASVWKSGRLYEVILTGGDRFFMINLWFFFLREKCFCMNFSIGITI